jgi:hypothetical protein
MCTIILKGYLMKNTKWETYSSLLKKKTQLRCKHYVNDEDFVMFFHLDMINCTAFHKYTKQSQKNDALLLKVSCARIMNTIKTKTMRFIQTLKCHVFSSLTFKLFITYVLLFEFFLPRPTQRCRKRS